MSFKMNGSPNYYARGGGIGSSRSFRYNSGGNGSNSPLNHSATPGGRSSQLYMGDLDPSWDENTIRNIWISLGEANVVIKLMWQNNVNGGGIMGPRNNLGYCFVEFPSMAHASNALLKNGMQIPNFGNKRLKLNWASLSHSSAGAMNEFSVFVGDLAPNVTESQLFELFISRFDSTSHVKIVYEKMTGVSKGFAFVRFTNPTHQQRALLEMQGIFLNGRAIRVSNAGHQQGMPDSKTKSVNSSSNGNGIVGSSQFMYPVQPQPSLNSFTDPNNTTVFVGGLSGLVSEDELRAYFQPFGTIVYVKIPVGKGCGFVQYVDRISAETAIAKMQGFPIGNSRVRLSWGRSAKQAATVQQAILNNNFQQQHQQQWQQLQQQQQPALQQPTYGYVPTSTSAASTPLSSFYNEMSYLVGGNSISPLQNPERSLSSAKMLLPGYQSVDYFGFPPSASGILSTTNCDYMPTPMQQHSSYIQNQVIGAVHSNDGINQPQIAVQNNDRDFIDSKTASLDRLENGSNGFIFA